MANVNGRHPLKEIVVFVVWMLSLAILIYALVLDFEKINYDIKNAEPAPAIEHINSEDYGGDLSSLDVEESNDVETNDDNVRCFEDYRQELAHKRDVYVCLMAVVFVYGVVGCILFFVVKGKSRMKALLYVFLTIVNIVAYNFPLIR